MPNYHARKAFGAGQALIETWNDMPIGTPVFVKKDDGSEVETETRSQAWMLGGHTPVIQLNGIAGSYLLERVRVRPAQ